MRFRLNPFTVLLIAALAASPPAWAARDSCLLRALQRLTHPAQDSAVELELDAVPEVMAILTTRNGKVSGLLERNLLPRGFKRWAKKNFPAYNDPSEIPWRELPADRQIQLINAMSSAQGARFWHDRKIDGLTTVERVRLTFAKRTVFLGKSYPKGTHEIDVSDYLLPVVEYAGPDDVGSLKSVEVHLRANRPAGELSNDARTFQTGLGLGPEHQHLHMVSPVPFKTLQANGPLEAARLGDFVRRANLAAEMVDIVHDGGGITSVTIGNIASFGSFTDMNIRMITRYFEALADGSAHRIGDQHKLGAVGMRGTDKYDQPGLWGLEYRSIHSYSRMKNHVPVLNGLQSTMTTSNLGMDTKRFEAWFASRPDVPGPTRVGTNWYNQEWPKLFRNSPRDIHPALKRLGESELIERADMYGELKMLVHDWADDPLFFDRPGQIRKIRSEQSRALERLAQGEDSAHVMHDFLLDSGIYLETLKSVGVEVRRRK